MPWPFGRRRSHDAGAPSATSAGRPITIDEGTNTLVGPDPERIIAAVTDLLATGGKRGRVPELWDGFAAQRIATHLGGWLSARASVGLA